MSDSCCFKKRKCDGDRVNNCWIEGGNPATGEGGVCLLDNLTDAQVIYIIERDEKAREDLKRVTTDENLLFLANNVPRLPTSDYATEVMREQNKNSDTIPYYSVFRGQGPYNG